MTVSSRIIHTVRLARHAARPGRRSTEWPALERHWLADHPECAACGTEIRLAVHHKVPFHVDPSRELDVGNLITLCMAETRHCHLFFGHGNDFHSYVEPVEDLAHEARDLYGRGAGQAIRDLQVKAQLMRKR
jgi:hypothetical protein